MKSQLALVALLLTGTIFLSGCFLGDLIDCVSANNTQITQSYSLPTFKAIQLDTDVDLVIIQDTAQSVEATGSDNLLNLLDLNVVGDVLMIKVDECLITSDLQMSISVAELDEIAILGAGNVSLPQSFITQDLKLKISGSGDMDLMLDSDDVTVEILGSGNVEMEGSAAKLDIRINGSGDVMAFDLPATDGDLKINGSGDVEVNLSGDLNGKITGSGNIYYKGSPSINVQVMGSGEIVDAN